MPPTRVREYLSRRPFRPCRLTLTDGRTYDVRHPELAMVGRGDVVIGLPAEEFDVPVYDRFVIVSLQHVMQIEPLEEPAAAAKN
ncbi:MAG TPA: hypothetical protein VML55_23500 [Planctomycetaceae bacterium]|nr:hypothetical protein [Planctomycetaceae bacterium]